MSHAVLLLSWASPFSLQPHLSAALLATYLLFSV